MRLEYAHSLILGQYSRLDVFIGSLKPFPTMRKTEGSARVWNSIRTYTGMEYTKTFRLAGRAWRERSMVFVRDLGKLTDCVRAPAAQRAGVKSGVALPLLVRGAVIGTMDFFSTETLDDLSESRAAALRNAVQLVAESVKCSFLTALGGK